MPKGEPLRIGSVIRERWRIDARLGHGAMSVVWAATHRNGDRVAIKVLKPDLAAEESVRVRFLREAYVANLVGHPGVVRVIDDDVAPDGAPLLVMDLLEGATLERRRVEAGGRLPVEEVVARLAELLSILDAAHAKGIVHRDIKPENLFVDTADRVRVLDFGIARVYDAASEVSTRTGTVIGTPEFMAPEQAAGRVSEIDGRSDLWSAAATAFMLLSGEAVHRGATLMELLNSVMGRPARPLREAAPHVPEALAAVIDRALLRDREARWPSAAAMRDALLAAMPSGAPVPDDDLETREIIDPGAEIETAPRPAVLEDVTTRERPAVLATKRLAAVPVQDRTVPLAAVIAVPPPPPAPASAASGRGLAIAIGVGLLVVVVATLAAAVR